MIDLSNDEIEFVYYCLEQQEHGFNPDEQKLCNRIINKFHSVQTDTD